MARGVDFFASVQGGEQLRRKLKRFEKEMFDELADSLPEEGGRLLAQANEAAPKASGELIASATLTHEALPSKGAVNVAAAYTDEKAAAVHEGVHGGQHVDETRGFKWFERALQAFESGFLERVARRLKRVVGGGS